MSGDDRSASAAASSAVAQLQEAFLQKRLRADVSRVAMASRSTDRQQGVTFRDSAGTDPGASMSGSALSSSLGVFVQSRSIPHQAQQHPLGQDGSGFVAEAPEEHPQQMRHDGDGASSETSNFFANSIALEAQFRKVSAGSVHVAAFSPRGNDASAVLSSPKQEPQDIGRLLLGPRMSSSPGPDVRVLEQARSLPSPNSGQPAAPEAQGPSGARQSIEAALRQALEKSRHSSHAKKQGGTRQAPFGAKEKSCSKKDAMEGSENIGLGTPSKTKAAAFGAQAHAGSRPLPSQEEAVACGDLAVLGVELWQKGFFNPTLQGLEELVLSRNSTPSDSGPSHGSGSSRTKGFSFDLNLDASEADASREAGEPAHSQEQAGRGCQLEGHLHADSEYRPLQNTAASLGAEREPTLDLNVCLDLASEENMCRVWQDRPGTRSGTLPVVPAHAGKVERLQSKIEGTRLITSEDDPSGSSGLTQTLVGVKRPSADISLAGLAFHGADECMLGGVGAPSLGPGFNLNISSAEPDSASAQFSLRLLGRRRNGMRPSAHPEPKDSGGSGAHQKAPLLIPGAPSAAVALAGSGQEVVMKRRLLMAAEAVDKGDMKAFEALLEHLRPFAKPRGNASERVVHVMLQALILRTRKEGFTFINSPPRRITVQDLNHARMWFFTAVPYIPFTCTFSTASIFPALIGKSSVHIVCWGETFVPVLPAVIKMLAKPLSKPDSPRGSANRPCLRSLWVTVLDPMLLVLPRRRDVSSMKSWGAVEASLEKEAQSMAVELHFKAIMMEEHDMHVLSEVERGPVEALAVCAAYQIKSTADCPGLLGGAIVEIMQLLQRLEPEVLAIAEEDVEASSPVFLERFVPWLDNQWAVFHCTEACTGDSANTRRFLQNFERIWYNLNTVNVLSCEGTDRRQLPHSRHGWQQWFQHWGFQDLPLVPSTVTGLQDLLKHYPLGFGLLQEGSWVCLTWQGSPLVCASAWMMG